MSFSDLQRLARTDPLRAMAALETMANVKLAINSSGAAPYHCVSPVDDVLALLGTTADAVLSADRKSFAIPSLQAYMEPNVHYTAAADGVIVFLSRRGMQRIAKDLSTPQADVVFTVQSGAMDAVSAMVSK